MQPLTLPRPDIAKLGVKYRRIPILSIGRDIYLDTRLILHKLEQLDGPPRLGAAPGTEHRAIERLLEIFNVDSGIFPWAAALMPRTLPILKDPRFLQDRAEFNNNRQRSGAEWAIAQPEALNEIRNAMEFLETTLLADGREWLLKTDTPSLADVEGVWPFHWVMGMPGAFPPDQISAKHFPKVFAWIERFERTVDAAKGRLAKPTTLSGDDAAKLILRSAYRDADGRVDESEPIARAQGLKKGGRATIWPTDTGSLHKDTGLLLSLNSKEVVIETKTEIGGSTVRVHAPRHGFRISHADQASKL